jgi:predicted metalloprotease with PDZ domain
MLTKHCRQVAGFLLLANLCLLPIGVRATAAATASGATAPIVLSVDATEAAKHLFHARMTIPAQAGALTLAYPKWMPGEHGPTGPVVDIVGLRLTAGGQPLAWKREPTDMFLYNVKVPAGATAVEAELDFVTPAATEGFSSGASASSNLMILSWNQVLLYPAGPNADNITFRADLRLPDGWKYGSALIEDGGASGSGASGSIRFKPVSLTTLIDSPLLAGAHFRTVPLSPPGDKHPAFLHIAAESEAALQAKPEVIDHYKRLVAEAIALFGARHYTQYHFLFTLSDRVAHFGLEHHESSDDRIAERGIVDDDVRVINADLLAHEMVHSWNAKYRRPAGLITNDYRQAIDSNMLWVYEGLTNYLGNILAARSGLWTPEQFRDFLAWAAATLDNRPGREWRPLVDTATAAQILYGSADGWDSMRRSVDFYNEGTLIWLEADTLIRKLSGGKKTLDDFCRLFHGGGDTSPMVKAYTDADVYAALNQVAPNDWKGFFDERVQRLRARAPLGGIEAGGWRLAYGPDKTPLQKAHESVDDITDVRFALGFTVTKDASLKDVIGGSPASKAGLAPGMKVVAVDGRRFSRQVLEDALTLGKDGKAPIEILAENSDFFRTYRIDYNGGPRSPKLEKVAGQPDVLTEIISPKAGTK